MYRSCLGLPTEEAVDFAFAHTQELARLLHKNGHRDVAALLDAIGDLGELSRRRITRGGENSLIGPGSETLDYVLAQMSGLAEIMAGHGVHEAATLFRMPGQLCAASGAGQLVAGATSMAA